MKKTGMSAISIIAMVERLVPQDQIAGLGYDIGTQSVIATIYDKKRTKYMTMGLTPYSVPSREIRDAVRYALHQLDKK